jgi:hypothetical protein
VHNCHGNGMCGASTRSTTYRVDRFAEGLCRDSEQREDVLAAPVVVERAVLLRDECACGFEVLAVCDDVFDVRSSGVVVVNAEKVLVCGGDPVFVLFCGVVEGCDCFCPPVNECIKVDLLRPPRGTRQHRTYRLRRRRSGAPYLWVYVPIHCHVTRVEPSEPWPGGAVDVAKRV